MPYPRLHKVSSSFQGNTLAISSDKIFDFVFKTQARLKTYLDNAIMISSFWVHCIEDYNYNDAFRYNMSEALAWADGSIFHQQLMH